MRFLSFESKILRKKYLTKDVLFLSLERPEEFEFKEGQFVNIEFVKGDKKRFKQYSMLSPPSQKDSLDLVVKIVEGGFASEIFKELKIGERLLVKGPFGPFYFKHEHIDKEQWMICAGTGVGPMHSMLKENLHKYPDTKFLLVFGVRKKENLFLHEEFLELQRKHPNFKYIPTLSKDTWEGETGRVQKHINTDFSNKIYYLCGLKDLVLETKLLLEKNSVPKELIKTERYN